MGLYLENEEKTQSPYWLFFQALLAIILPIILLMLVGCVKKDESIDYGEEVAVDQIRDAYDQVALEANINKSQVGDFVRRDHTIVVKPSLFLLKRRENITLKERKEDESDVLFTIFRERRDCPKDKSCPPDDTEVTAESEQNLLIPKEHLSPAQQMAKVLNEIIVDPAHWVSLFQEEQSFTEGEESKYPYATYHKLSMSTSKEKPPEIIAEQEGCGNLSGCMMEVTRISYDRVVHFSEEDREKVSFWTVFSHEVPYIATVMEDCARLQLEDRGRRFLATVCDKVKDYSFGSL